ncbi:cytochrome c oxidase assembly protein COX16 homolog, mitochondrial isoform X2 [Pogona vitticeps]|uniref:Cytochrome c oxidase assembly protein COX16 homolog, mitochondrial n=1 Tax=Pogona vitticeps TaxID=103695 RepID=A0A6J0T690_9SAUR|nr:cytochrome c oxidase assembly protein COX16 homolog, mitochondrial isoform X1 [Pogona vitticeps]XP_020644122.1 cytochrome c oxidase assembly protein COX16 homolog, mitochondrial isoform X1 [Pogona vitticeps]
MPLAIDRLRALKKNKTFKYGLPMLVLAVAGSLAIRELTQVRIDVKKYHTQVDPALQEEHKKKIMSLEEEYEKIKDSAFEDWKNIRGPRPWEDSKSTQDLQRQQQ